MLLAIIIAVALIVFFFYAYVVSPSSSFSACFTDSISLVDVSQLVNAVVTANGLSMAPAGYQARNLRQANGSNSNIHLNHHRRHRDTNPPPSMDMGRTTVQTRGTSASSSTDLSYSNHQTHMRETAYIHPPRDHHRFIRSRGYRQRCLRTTKYRHNTYSRMGLTKCPWV